MYISKYPKDLMGRIDVKKKTLKLILCVAVVSILLLSIVYASGITKTIEVVFNSVNLTVNGTKVNADTSFTMGQHRCL